MSYDFHTESIHVARKRSVCECCHQAVAPGQVYAKYVGVWDGDFFSAKMHVQCRDLRLALAEFLDPYAEGFQFSVCEEMSDNWAPVDAQASLDAERGHHPHAVCRVEFKLRSWLEEAP